MPRMLRFPLSKKFEKPVIELNITEPVKCLLDTGASMAVWCSTLDYFLQIFEYATKAENQTLLSGFGGNGEFVDVFKIPLLRIQAENDEMKFRFVYVAVLNRPRFGVDFAGRDAF